jgi:stage III sporulation protein AH
VLVISFYKVKRLAIIAAIVLILFIAINIINLMVNGDSQPVSQEMDSIEQLQMPVESVNANDDEGIGFFSEYRIERERVRGKQMELLRMIANNPVQEQKIRDNAALKMVQIADELSREIRTETLIKSKGYKECAVILDPQGMTIILDKNVLLEKQKAELLELSSAVSGIEREKIKITSRQQYH